jgi:hypothetical protein
MYSIKIVVEDKHADARQGCRRTGAHDDQGRSGADNERKEAWAMALFSPKEKGTSAASPFSPTNTDSHFIFQKKDKTNRKFSGATET